MTDRGQGTVRTFYLAVTYQYLFVLGAAWEALGQVEGDWGEGDMGENSGLAVAPGHAALIIVVLHAEHDLTPHWEHHPSICRNTQNSYLFKNRCQIRKKDLL